MAQVGFSVNSGGGSGVPSGNLMGTFGNTGVDLSDSSTPFVTYIRREEDSDGSLMGRLRVTVANLCREGFQLVTEASGDFSEFICRIGQQFEATVNSFLSSLEPPKSDFDYHPYFELGCPDGPRRVFVGSSGRRSARDVRNTLSELNTQENDVFNEAVAQLPTEGRTYRLRQLGSSSTQTTSDLPEYDLTWVIYTLSSKLGLTQSDSGNRVYRVVNTAVYEYQQEGQTTWVNTGIRLKQWEIDEFNYQQAVNVARDSILPNLEMGDQCQKQHESPPDPPLPPSAQIEDGLQITCVNETYYLAPGININNRLYTFREYGEELYEQFSNEYDYLVRRVQELQNEHPDKEFTILDITSRMGNRQGYMYGNQGVCLLHYNPGSSIPGFSGSEQSFFNRYESLVGQLVAALTIGFRDANSGDPYTEAGDSNYGDFTAHHYVIPPEARSVAQQMMQGHSQSVNGDSCETRPYPQLT